MRRLLRPADRDGGVAIGGLRRAVVKLMGELAAARNEVVLARLEAERLRGELEAVKGEVAGMKRVVP